MNLVRLGHYFVPNSSEEEAVTGSCRTALVIHVWNKDDPANEMVNIAVWNGDGSAEHRSSVPVGLPSGGGHSFHLSGDCPWKR